MKHIATVSCPKKAESEKAVMMQQSKKCVKFGKGCTAD